MTRKADIIQSPEDLVTRIALPPPSCSPALRRDSSRFARIAAAPRPGPRRRFITENTQ